MQRVKTGIACVALTAVLLATGVRGEQIVFRRHSNTEKRIALTFDDGPHPAHTPSILDILDEYGVKATFFMIGKNVKLYPDLVARVRNRGHEVGNHTFSHCMAEKSDKKTAHEEVSRGGLALEEVLGEKPKFFRPPGGVISDTWKEAARAEGCQIILWSVDTRDWAHTTVEQMLRNVRRNIDSGDIILCHDYTSGSTHTEEFLRVIIPELQALCYEFVTVSQLLSTE